MSFIDEIVSGIVHRNLVPLDTEKIKMEIEGFKEIKDVFVFVGTNTNTIKKSVKEKIQIHGDDFVQMEDIPDFIEKEIHIVEEIAVLSVYFEWKGEKKSVKIELPGRIKTI
jgi:hydroxymethylglutaryl-CoA reductase